MMQGKMFGQIQIIELISTAFGGKKGSGKTGERKIYSAKAQPGEKRTVPTLKDLMRGGMVG